MLMPSGGAGEEVTTTKLRELLLHRTSHGVKEASYNIEQDICDGSPSL